MIDAGTLPDALVQLSLLAGPDDPVVSVGPPPAAPFAPRAEAVHRPMGSARAAGLRLRGRAANVDLLQAWSPDAMRAGRELSLASGRPLLASLPTAGSRAEVAALAEAVGPGLLSVTVPTSAARARLLAAGLPGRSVAVLPPAARPPADREAVRRRTRRRLGAAPDCRVLVAPDALIRPSGHETAVWAFAMARHMLGRLKLVIPGDGEAGEHVRSFAAGTGFGEEVLFTQWDLTADELLAAADVAMFCPRRSVGAGMLAGAMAAGLAIVASDTPDAAELAPHGEAALLAVPGSPRQAAAALLKLLDDAELAARLGAEASRRAAERFGPDLVRRRLKAIHAETLDAKVF